jgi:hypothetical protein
VTADRNVTLSAFARWGDGRIVAIGQPGARGRAGMPLDFSAQGLASCATVILGDLAPDALPPGALEALREFVDRGGGLVIMGGPESVAKDLGATPLRELLPVRTPAEYREGQFGARITEGGLRHPVFGQLFSGVTSLPTMLSLNVAPGVAPTAEVLLEARAGETAAPLVAAMRYGEGRVVMVMTNTLWRWRLAAEGWSGPQSPYDTFWAQLMDWLLPKEQERAGGDKLDLFAERPNYLVGERPEIRAILRAGGGPGPRSIPLQVRTPDDRTFEYNLEPATLRTASGKEVQGYRAVVDPNVPGVFHAKARVRVGSEDVEAEARFIVNKPVTERTGQPIRRELLEGVAAATGGSFLPIDRWGEWRASLKVTEQRFSRLQLKDLWNHPMLLAAALALLAGEWVLRKYNHLP